MDWEDRLDEWELELELNAQLEGSDWVTLERAAVEPGVSRAALRTWYRTGQIPSRLVDGPHGPQRLVPLTMVAARAEASPRLRHSAERRLADEAQVELLRHRVDQLELRLAALERLLPSTERPQTCPPVVPRAAAHYRASGAELPTILVGHWRLYIALTTHDHGLDRMGRSVWCASRCELCMIMTGGLPGGEAAN